ncbi:UNVERIFIED_CONTAM: hypothetical protein RMT77_012537 [Armadillidium vulgare]
MLTIDRKAFLRGDCLWLIFVILLCIQGCRSDHGIFNVSCAEGCVCEMSGANHVHQELRTYDCSYASLKELPKNLPNDTEVLNLRGNSIFNVENEISRLTQLHELDLSANRIKSIGRGRMFQNTSNLVYMNVAKNDISTIFHDNLLGPKNLLSLILSNNRINYIEDEAFNDLIHLQKLDLEQNLLGSLYEEWFFGLTQLNVLNLAHNRVHNIPATVFRPLYALERLYLSGNRISQIDPRAFSGLTRLKVLTLEDNLISIIPTPAFQSLPELEILTLDQNPILKIKPLDFSHLSVSKISLCQMSELRVIDSKAFYNLENLRSLHITDNKNLRYIDPLAFMNINELKELQLHNNALYGIQPDIIDYIPDNVNITLFGNPFLCDCNVRWIVEAFGKNNTKNIEFIEPQHLVCSYPVELAHKLIKDLNKIDLKDSCPPTILNLTQSLAIEGKVGERQVLECRSIGSPRPALHWILPDGTLINSTLNEVRRRFFPPGTLVYYHLKPSDSGQFSCVAENEEGKDTSNLTLSVTGIDVHLFPVAASSTFVTLVWNGTERTSFPKYTIMFGEWNPNNESIIGIPMTRSATSLRKTFTIGSLEPSKSYRFCLGYKDSGGYWLKLSCCIANTQDAHFLVQGISSSHRAAVIGIVAFGALVGIVFCLISFGSRQYKHRLYQNPDKLGGSSTSALGLNDDPSGIPMDNLYRPLLTGS